MAEMGRKSRFLLLSLTRSKGGKSPAKRRGAGNPLL